MFTKNERSKYMNYYVHTMENKKEILKNAADAINRQTGLNIVFDWQDGGQDPYCADVGIALPVQGDEYRFCVEIKTHIAAADALLPLVQKGGRQEEFLLVTRHVTVEMAERLRKNGIQFMDEAGNAFFNRPPLYIFIKGNKNPELSKKPVLGRAFKQTGLKILFTLLCNPGMETQTYRVIAARAGVALGMIDWVMRELKELGFMHERGKGRARKIQLTNKEKLLERWITAYAEQLRPKLLLGRYRGAPGWWQNTDIRPQHAKWGGEAAAAKMTGYLKPEIVTIYLNKELLHEMLIANKLRKDPDGDVEALHQFWKQDIEVPYTDTVHPLLVYADLIATGNQRNLEAAKIIYDRHIVQLVREA